MKRIDNYSLLNEETLLSTANGYVGMRANFEEGYALGYESIVSTYINGFYDIYKVCYGEKNYGLPETAQQMVSVHNAQSVSIYIDGHAFNVFEGTLKELHRELDIKNGYAVREVKWQSPKGNNFEFTFKRMASFKCLQLITIDIEIKSVDYSGIIEIVSMLKGKEQNTVESDDPRAGAEPNITLKVLDIKVKDNIQTILSRTTHSNLRVATACSYNMDMEVSAREDYSTALKKYTVKKGDKIKFVKYIAFSDSIRQNNPEKAAYRTVKEAVEKGVDYYYREQKAYLDKFWKYAYINIDGDKDLEYALNYNVYQLLASAGKDEHCNIGAKGLSGSGYEGHYFWDIEIYMMPFFLLTMPDIAKNLLKFRYNELAESKQNAQTLGHAKGAKIPWRTISGSECSSYFPAGSAQYHINADIAYAYIQYYIFTDDLEMISEFGYEVIYETARIWLETGNYNGAGEFCINTVTGPDEYTALVDNNYYTNSMAKYHLEWAVRLGEQLKNDDEQKFNNLCRRLNIEESEINEMKEAAHNMRLPFDEELNIHKQDESFLNKKEWDFENTPKDKYPLLLNYHPMYIYRHKVLKQADTILSYVLLDNVQEDIMCDSYDYYRQRTTHDSSLSPCVYSIMAARVGRIDEAYDYFMSTIKLDLDDLNKNTKDGLHIANAGGAYMALVYGFGGLRIKKEGLHLRPAMPSKWNGYSFGINYRGKLMKINVGKMISISCEEPVEIYIYGKKYKVTNELNIALES